MLIAPPRRSADAHQAAASGRKQCGVPAPQPVGREWTVIMLCRVEYHLNDAVDVPVGGLQSADLHAQPSRQRRSHLLQIETLAFDLAALHHVGGEGFESRLLIERKSQRLHTPGK